MKLLYRSNKRGPNLDHFVILELSSLRLIPHHAKILPARQSVASSCALILIVTQDCADIQCDFAFCFFNHFGCCNINHYNGRVLFSSLIITMSHQSTQFWKIMLYNLELQVFPDHFSCVVFPRNYQLAKIHFRVIALVKAFKFNLSSVIFRNSAFSNSIISTHKDLREILPHRKHRVTSQLSLASSSLVLYPLLTLSKPKIKWVLTMKVNRVPAWRSIDNSKNYFWPKLAY